MTRRRAVREGESDTPRVEKQGRLWRIRSLEASRQVLRARHATTQAGFTAEYIPRGRMEHRPILISDGPVHDEQRSAVARFFAPAVVRERYAADIAACAERRLDEAAAAASTTATTQIRPTARTEPTTDAGPTTQTEPTMHTGPTTSAMPGAEGFALDDLALYYTVEVTADIVGLTHERRRDTPAARERRIRAMAHRLVAFFDQPPFDLSRDDLGRTPREWARAARKGLAPIVGFYLADVRPAVRQRRTRPADDVLSHLIRQGYSTTDLLIEAVTYGTAGMVTTREFITMAAWHLLTTPDLAAHYSAAPEAERLALLAELIRIEPVVGHLYRRVQQPITVTDGETCHELAVGDLVDVQVRSANVDPVAVDLPFEVCPHRRMPPGVRSTVLTFGDGAHRCPGEPLALLEADILLTRLLARSPRLVREPDLSWDDLVSGYELRGLRVVLDAPPGT